MARPSTWCRLKRCTACRSRAIFCFSPGGAGTAGDSATLSHGAYRVNRIEHIYAPVFGPRTHTGQARLAKAVAHVDRLMSPQGESRSDEKEAAEPQATAVGKDDLRSIHMGRPASFYTPAMSDAPFSYQIQPGQKDGTQILALTGPLTLNTMFGFQNEFRATRPPVLIIDMTECPYIDSAGLGLLMKSVRLCGKWSAQVPACRSQLPG